MLEPSTRQNGGNPEVGEPLALNPKTIYYILLLCGAGDAWEGKTFHSPSEVDRDLAFCG